MQSGYFIPMLYFYAHLCMLHVVGWGQRRTTAEHPSLVHT